MARWLREQVNLRDHPRLLVVAVIGCGGYEDFRRSVTASIDFHLVKPVALDELMRVLTEYRWQTVPSGDLSISVGQA